MKYTLILLMFMNLNLALAQSNCPCKSASDAETTHWGNDPVQYSGIDTVKRIYGKVVNTNGESLGDALVEVFEPPAEKIYVYHLDSRKRVAACKTGPDGSFCFAALRPKQYVVCASAGHGELKASCRSIKLVPRGARGSGKGLSFELGVSI
jgi:protocatechuate 3,4-dioxygenase beta subunit